MVPLARKVVYWDALSGPGYFNLKLSVLVLAKPAKPQAFI